MGAQFTQACGNTTSVTITGPGSLITVNHVSKTGQKKKIISFIIESVAVCKATNNFHFAKNMNSARPKKLVRNETYTSVAYTGRTENMRKA